MSGKKQIYGVAEWWFVIAKRMTGGSGQIFFMNIRYCSWVDVVSNCFPNSENFYLEKLFPRWTLFLLKQQLLLHAASFVSTAATLFSYINFLPPSCLLTIFVCPILICCQFFFKFPSLIFVDETNNNSYKQCGFFWK